jgi:hypothetical protein
VQPDPPQFPDPAEPSGAWDSLAFGAAEPPSPRRRKLLAALVAAGALVVAGVGVAEFTHGSSMPGSAGPEPRVITLTPHPSPPSTYLSMDGSTRPLLTGRPLPAATLASTGLGSDPMFDRLAQQCADGSMRACDELYDASPAGSRYESFADSCAGRQPRNTNIYCVTAFRGS